MKLQLLKNGYFIRIDQATKYESFDERTTLYKTKKGAWALHTHTPGDMIDKVDMWVATTEKIAYEWLIENDHAEAIPDDDLDQLEI